MNTWWLLVYWSVSSWLISQKRNFFFIGSILFGRELCFSALGGLEQLSDQIPKNSYMANPKWTNRSSIFLLLFGAAVTAIIQSSTAFTGILMSFSGGGGTIPLLDVYYLLLGANIGTCLTVILVGLSHKPKLRIVAYIHVWINVIGSIDFFPPGNRTSLRSACHNHYQSFRSTNYFIGIFV